LHLHGVGILRSGGAAGKVIVTRFLIATNGDPNNVRRKHARGECAMQVRTGLAPSWGLWIRTTLVPDDIWHDVCVENLPEMGCAKPGPAIEPRLADTSGTYRSRRQEQTTPDGILD